MVLRKPLYHAKDSASLDASQHCFREVKKLTKRRVLVIASVDVLPPLCSRAHRYLPSTQFAPSGRSGHSRSFPGIHYFDIQPIHALKKPQGSDDPYPEPCVCMVISDDAIKQPEPLLCSSAGIPHPSWSLSSSSSSRKGYL